MKCPSCEHGGEAVPADAQTDSKGIWRCINPLCAVITFRETIDLSLHPALAKPYWVNLYPDGKISSALCQNKYEALNRCTYTGQVPDAKQVEVRLLLTPNLKSG